MPATENKKRKKAQNILKWLIAPDENRNHVVFQLVGGKFSYQLPSTLSLAKWCVTSTLWYVFDRRAIIMLTSRMTPMIRKTPKRKCARVTEALSTESSGSNSAIPSRDHVRCFTMLHQLHEQQQKQANVYILWYKFGLGSFSILVLNWS